MPPRGIARPRASRGSLIDLILVRLVGGRGGDGCSSYNRQPHQAVAAANGGPGGAGGDVILRAETVNHHLHLSGVREFRAPSGEPGGKEKSSGKRGRPLVIKVPVGTVVRDVSALMPEMIERTHYNYMVKKRQEEESQKIQQQRQLKVEENREGKEQHRLATSQIYSSMQHQSINARDVSESDHPLRDHIDINSPDSVDSVEYLFDPSSLPPDDQDSSSEQKTDLSSQFTSTSTSPTLYDPSLSRAAGSASTLLSQDTYSLKDHVPDPLQMKNSAFPLRRGSIIIPIKQILREAPIIADLNVLGKEVVVVKGGKGGYGNAHFKSPINRSPTHTKGELGETKTVALELKSIADVALLGLPNTGKSSFLKRVTASNPKIAMYPFTTLRPILGVVPPLEETISVQENTNAMITDKHRNTPTGTMPYLYKPFTIADIPGIIKGASKDRGLGLEVLRHAERTKIMAFVIDLCPLSEKQDPITDLKILEEELHHYASDDPEHPWSKQNFLGGGRKKLKRTHDEEQKNSSLYRELFGDPKSKDEKENDSIYLDDSSSDEEDTIRPPHNIRHRSYDLSVADIDEEKEDEDRDEDDMMEDEEHMSAQIIVIANKIDAGDVAKQNLIKLVKVCNKRGYPVFPVSALEGYGVAECIDYMRRLVHEKPKRSSETPQ